MFKVNNLKAWYKEDKLILDNINFEIENGTICGFVGVNGAGKTTLLNSICNIHENYTGNIFINDMEIKKNNRDGKKMRYFIPDHPVLFNELSGYSYIELIHKLYDKKLYEEQLEYYCERFNFKKYINQTMGSLSLGNRQKAAIICGFLLETPLLILDEPLVGLDALGIDRFYEEIRKYAEKGNTVIFSTHLLEVAEVICNKIIVLHQGSIKKCIYNDRKNLLKDEFFKVINNEG
ncbi:MAG: ABC transporter ATP-binding protein [Clostridium sp.]